MIIHLALDLGIALSLLLLESFLLFALLALSFGQHALTIVLVVMVAECKC